MWLFVYTKVSPGTEATAIALEYRETNSLTFSQADINRVSYDLGLPLLPHSKKIYIYLRVPNLMEIEREV